MAAFWNKDNKNKEKESVNDKKQSSAVISKSDDKKKPKKKKVASADLKKKAELVNNVIIRPVISEKAMNQQTVGKYVFEVGQDANTKTVSESIGVLYGVDVLKVNLMNYKQKKRNFRNFRGQQKAVKKAIVTIKSGQEIKLFNE